MKWYPVTALALLSVTDAIAGTALTVLAPDITRALGVSAGAFASLLAVQLVAAAVAPVLVASVVGGRAIRAVVAITTGFVWSVCIAAMGFVGSMWMLGALILLNGLANGSISALHTPLLTDLYPKEQRGRVLALYGAGGPAASVLGPLAVAGLTGWLGLDWRVVFFVIGAVAIAACVVAMRLRDPGVGAREETGPGSPDDSFRTLFRIPTVRRMLAGFAVFGMMLLPGATFMAIHLEQRWGLQAGERGLFMTAYALGAVVVLLTLGRKLDGLFQSDPRKVVKLCAAIVATSAGGIALGAAAPFLALCLAAFFLAMMATALIVPVVALVGLSVATPAQRGHFAAVFTVTLAGGGLLGAGLLMLAEKIFGGSGAIAAVAVPGVLAACVIISAVRTIRADLGRGVPAHD
ncbi:MFS transporter [Nonomuraea sp. NBC_01738]|uniref:MFS transporter n=1 Tax=Nonomuraea sp. NBC_01738 TaxID=2976003 RepID=UPI002E11A23B|nr:MFS transporter [Nonomuraea sp. NBC_01738]